MCLSVPAKVLEVNGQIGKVDVDGNIVEVNFSTIEGVAIGDYVLVHAGFAIEKYEEEEALKTIALLKEALEPDTDSPGAE